MLALEGYDILEKIYEGKHSLVYRCVRLNDNKPVMIKLLRKEYPDQKEILRFLQEYELSSQIHLSGVVTVYGLEQYNNTPVIVMEDFGGDSLVKVNPDYHWDLITIWKLFINVAEILGEIHRKGIIHKDINPSNIVWNQETNVLKIIDFGISTDLRKENPESQNPELMEGTLAYMSPEQTGRMNRSLDYRSDYYSLGVTFYELISGIKPFHANNPMTMIHCHIAKMPPDLDEMNSDIPKSLSLIIRKLMLKNAEDRYQSSVGLIYDIKESLQNYLHGGEKSFSPGRYDVWDKLNITEKLYGREKELSKLKLSLDINNKEKASLILISGYSGIGKTSLVREAKKIVEQNQGIFISGKFNEMSMNIPHMAISEAFRQLTLQILAEDDEKIQERKTLLLKHLKNNAQLIIDVIPELEHIIGKQNEVPALAPKEAENRFLHVFQSFVKALAPGGRSLVIFLDDLQWVNLASLKLIQSIILNLDSQNITIIGAYRDNEVAEDHCLNSFIKDIHKESRDLNKNLSLYHFMLSPLALNDIDNLVRDVLNTSENNIHELAYILMDKTYGNPFFINQFLLAIYQDKLLRFHHDSGKWLWDISGIKKLDSTDNVVDLMVSKIMKLSSGHQNVIKMASCIGKSFDLRMISLLLDKSMKETAKAIYELLLSELLIPIGDVYKYAANINQDDKSEIMISYRFSHDKIHQACYSLLTEDEKERVHLKIGQHLLDNDKNNLNNILFDIVNHMNIGVKYLANDTDKLELIKLNLSAAGKAKRSSAYESAYQYLNQGYHLLAGLSNRDKEYNLFMECHLELAEAAYLVGNYEKTHEMTEIILKKARNVWDKLRIYEIVIATNMSRNKVLDAIKIGLTALKLVNIKLPSNPGKLNVLYEYLKINRMLLFKSVDDLYELDLSDDDKHKIIMRLLANISSAAYFAQPLLSPLLIFKMIKLSVINGLTSESAFAFVSYGLMIQGFFNRLDMGYQFGKMALELVDKHNFITEKPKVSMVYSLVNRWREADINTLKLLTEGYQCGLDTGDFWFGGLCGMAYPSNMFIIGHHSLSDNLNALQEYGQNIKKIKQYTSANFTNFYHQITLNLIGASPEAWKLSGPVYDEEIQVARHIAAMDKTMLFSYHTVKMMLCYMFHQYDEALYHGLETEKYMEGGLGLAKLVLYHVYLSLIHLALADNPAVGINKRLKIVKQNQRKVKHWAENSPENYAGFYYLVEAELAKVTRQDLKAMESYDQAIDIFHSHQLLRDEALANELAGRYHFSRQRDHFGRNYIVEARYRYDLWGAQAKVKDLEDIYPELLSRQSLASSLNPETLSSMTEVSSDYGEMQLIDLSTVVKAAESLSSEIVLSKLLSSLMTQAIENSGAQKGCLIVSKNDKWHIIAQVSEKSVIVNSPDQDDSEQDMAVPMNIILYVSRVKTYIIVDQAEQDSRFNIDPYIKKFKPKSILCLPLINKGKLNGILYLENNLNHRVFNSSRVRIMDLLSSLMAISLENATLYSDLTGLNERLENMVEERTHKLRQSEEKYKALFLYNPDIVFSMDLDGVFSSVNPNSEEIAGYTSKEVIGSHFKQLLPKEQIPKIEKKIDEVIKGKPQYFETVILHKNGEKLIMDITAVPIVVEDKVLGVYGIAKDITKRKQIEAALIEQEEEHRLLIELLPDGIVIHRDDKILYINQSAISILAVKSPDEVLGKSVFQFLHPDSRESFNKNIQNIQEEKISDKLLELKLLNDSGKVVETEAALSKIRYRGSQSLITILRDISQRKRLERLKEEVERTMHHDLKSPLLAIMGFSKMLLNREIGTKEKEWIQSIQESSHKMKYLISRSFDLFKMEEGSYLSNPQDINMVNFLKNIKKSFTPMIEIKSLRMDFRLNEERISEMKDYSIRSDENLLDILFNNLLKNALEASPEHSVVSVHIDSAENGYHIDIHNYGMVDDRVSERFFERYVTAGKKDGTGLGTYSAYLVVKTLGGTIRFTSSKSQGTHLLIHLPR